MRYAMSGWARAMILACVVCGAVFSAPAAWAHEPTDEHWFHERVLTAEFFSRVRVHLVEEYGLLWLKVQGPKQLTNGAITRDALRKGLILEISVPSQEVVGPVGLHISEWGGSPVVRILDGSKHYPAEELKQFADVPRFTVGLPNANVRIVSRDYFRHKD